MAALQQPEGSIHSQLAAARACIAVVGVVVPDYIAVGSRTDWPDRQGRMCLLNQEIVTFSTLKIVLVVLVSVPTQCRKMKEKDCEHCFGD